MVMLLFAIFKSFVSFFRHHAVAIYYITYVKCAAALSEVDGSTHADIFVSLVVVAVTHSPHFAKVNLFACLTKNFIFKK